MGPVRHSCQRTGWFSNGARAGFRLATPGGAGSGAPSAASAPGIGPAKELTPTRAAAPTTTPHIHVRFSSRLIASQDQRGRPFPRGPGKPGVSMIKATSMLFGGTRGFRLPCMWVERCSRRSRWLTVQDHKLEGGDVNTVDYLESRDAAQGRGADTPLPHRICLAFQRQVVDAFVRSCLR
ncbi:hypothetical protein FRAHR75_430056 [Frankia sp. Hr75.2]|nr:hypothetical protein FRAHR75_430056 [Frankia sp. Hr75.2]